MNPDNYNNQVPQNPSVPQAGQVYGGGSAPQSPQNGPAQNPLYQPPQPNSEGSGSNKKIFIILGALLVIFVITIIVYLLIPDSGNKKQEPVQQTSQPQTLVREPSAIDIEDVNNSISDDVSNLADDNDFPADTLTDEKLEL